MPANPSLNPSLPAALPTEPVLAAAISTALGYAGTLWRLGTGTADSLYFRMDRDHGDRLFVKLVAAAAAPPLLAADGFARLVRDGGLSTAILVASPALPVICPPSLLPPGLAEPVVLAYPHCEGHPPRAAMGDMELLGDAVARLHALLAARVHEATAVRRAGAERLHVIKARWTCLVTEAGTRSPFRNQPWFMPAGPSQILHGDLNPGNLLVGGGHVTFLDFENTGHSWLPPVTEIAFILERMVLAAIPDDGKAFDVAAAFLAAYSRHQPLPPRGTLSVALLWLSLRALAILSLLAEQGRPRPVSERDKFLSLLELHKQRRALVARLDTLLD